MPLSILILSAALAVATASYAAEPAPNGEGAEPAAAVSPAAEADKAPEVIAALSGPKIIEVGPEFEAGAEEEFEGEDGPVSGPALRHLLLREFPDELVERMWIQDWQDAERAYQYGRLVDVPSDPDGRGIRLRLEGASRIGELVDDAYRQMLLCRLTKPAAGLLYRIASRLRLMEGEAYEPLEITSLLRTWDYQIALTDVNPNADRTRDGVPPTHVLGLAFDIARSRMSEERQQRIEFLFDQLARDGELAYYKEGSHNGLEHYHVIALPSAEFSLARHFERETHAAEKQEVAQQRHRYVPESPCVTFGSSLEPFSAICSCELPLEVSAAGLAGDAPISR